jgi:CHAT domain-containing protein
VTGLALIVVAVLAAAPDTPRGRLDQAAAALTKRDAGAALPLLQPLVDEGTLDDPSLLTEAHHYLGQAYWQRGEYPSSLAHFSKALALSRTVALPQLEGRTLQAMAQVLKNQGDYAQALSRARDAIAVFESLGDSEGAGRAWVVIGAVHDLQADYRSALEDYRQARERLEPSKSQAFYRLLNEIGITHKNLGNFEEALAHYHEGLAAQERAGDTYGQAVTLSNMGVAYHLLGQLEPAIECYQRALALARTMGDPRGQSFVLGNLAELFEEDGQSVRALELLQQQRELARGIGSRVSEANALANQGSVLVTLGRLAEARAQYEQALAMRRDLGSRADVSSSLAALARLALRESRPIEATGLGAEALRLAQEVGSPELEWRARLVLARAARVSGDSESAIAHLRSGVEVVNGVRGRVLSDAGKVGYLDTRQTVFYELVDALDAAGRPGEALEVAEAARSRAFADLLAGREVALEPIDAASLKDIREAEASLRAQTRLAAAGPSTGDETLRRRAAVETDLGRRLRSLQTAQPELASLVVAEPVAASEIAATARRLDATIVEYFVTDARLFIWVVSPAGPIQSVAVGLPRAELRQKVRALQDALNGVDLAGLRRPGPVRALLADLYRWVLAPVERHLPRDPTALVYVVPHDVLLAVPFAALVDERGRYAIERHTMASAPSLGVLRYTADKKRLTSTGAPHLLALADPRPPEDAGLGRLPGAVAEVQAIGRSTPPSRRTILIAEQASEANVKRLGGGQTFLHFAVHGLIRDDRPWQSALLLSAGEGEDGWLRASEVFGLDLRADMVVLSGCSTGLGKVTGDGVLGLARAFFYAGTPSVVVSQWDVSDRATAFVMERFYARLHAGSSKAHALRSAQLAARARFSHPALWAAFALVGEPR